MTRSLGVKAWATGAAVLVAVVGCANSGSGANPPSPSSPSSPSAPTTPSSSSPPTDSEMASTSAKEVVRRYFTVLDELRQDPSKAMNQLSSVTTSTQLAAQKRLLATERGQGLHQVGTTRIADLTVQSISLDNSDPAAGKVPSITVDVCWDVSDVDILGKDGRSVVGPDREPVGWTRYTVANYHWAKNPSDGWRIATGRDLVQKSCAPA
jgi:hypothetical protein